MFFFFSGSFLGRGRPWPWQLVAGIVCISGRANLNNRPFSRHTWTSTTANSPCSQPQVWSGTEYQPVLSCWKNPPKSKIPSIQNGSFFSCPWSGTRDPFVTGGNSLSKPKRIPSASAWTLICKLFWGGRRDGTSCPPTETFPGLKRGLLKKSYFRSYKTIKILKCLNVYL